MKAKRLFFIGILTLLVSLLMFVSFSNAMITSITLTSPTNNTWTSSPSPSFTFRAISNSDPTFVCSLIINGGIIATNSSTANNTLTTLAPMISLSQGMHRWNITCADSVGTLTSETRTLYIDYETPNVTLISPADGYNSSSREIYFKFKATDNFDTSLNCVLYVDGEKEKEGTVNNNTQTTWTVENLTREEHEWQVKCKDNANNQGESATWDFNIEGVKFCKYGEQGRNLKFSIDSPDSGDDIYAGENISVRVTVENTANEDLNIVIKAELYDLDDEDSVVSTNYKTKIKEDTEKTYTLYLKIPTTLDEDNDYVINAKVYEDGNEDDECKEDSIDVNIKKRKHSVVIPSFSLNPKTVECGKSFGASFKIENAGSSDEDVKIAIKNSDLRIDFLKDITLDSGEDYSETLNFNVPNNASEKNYSIVLIVYYNDYEDSVSDTEILEVKGNCFVETKDVSFSSQQLSEAFNGREFVVKIIVTNTGNVATTYTVSASDYEAWATLLRIEPSSLNLEGGESRDVYIYLTPSENSSGANTFKVKVSFGSITKEQTITINVRRQTTPASFFDQLVFELKRNWQYILIDIILVAAVIILLIAWLRQRAKIQKMLGGSPTEIRVRTINEKEFRKAKKS